jgi:hypothetical protein
MERKELSPRYSPLGWPKGLLMPRSKVHPTIGSFPLPLPCQMVLSENDFVLPALVHDFGIRICHRKSI